MPQELAVRYLEMKMSKFILHILSILLAMLCLVSCSRSHRGSSLFGDDNDETWEGGTIGDQTMLVLRISPLNSQETSQAPAEKVKTLRIIIINHYKNIIECNRSIDIPTTAASLLSYTLTWPTVSGKKDVYVIANENSVAENFGEILDGYTENSVASTLQERLQAYHFAPTYSEYEEDGSIYLPYTYYYGSLEAKKEEATAITAYLVPVATKFIFNFTNNRDFAVKVNGISLESVNSSNYLFAKVGEKDIEKNFNGEPYYWIDWLAEVAQASPSGFSSNQEFNNYYGWISDYEIPSEDNVQKHIFIETNESFEVLGTMETSDNTPGKYTVGPFYIPESKNLTLKNDSDKDTSDDDDNDDDKTLTEQTYYLTIGLEDTDPNKTAPEFKDVVIPNLKALFRNTYVIINVNMSQGDIEIYAEIHDWTKQEVNGWVTEGQPTINPLSNVRNK